MKFIDPEFLYIWAFSDSLSKMLVKIQEVDCRRGDIVVRYRKLTMGGNGRPRPEVCVNFLHNADAEYFLRFYKQTKWRDLSEVTFERLPHGHEFDYS